MIEVGMVTNGNEWKKNDRCDYVKLLNKQDYVALLGLYREVDDLRGDDLIRYVYINYPYFAIRSTIATNLLRKEELDAVRKAIPIVTGTCLFTIGYEGKTVEAYINQLIQHNVKVLYDEKR